MKWTEQQYDAIMHDQNENILVSAGAGSGKTAILSERVIRKLKDGVNINQLLILTFTKAASEEMKERIRKKIIDNNLQEQLKLLDSSYITTFDSYALSMVKKYHYLLQIDKNISLTDDTILKLERYRIINEILDKKYQQQEESFLNLLKTIVKKDDNTLIQEIESMLDKIDLEIDTTKYFKILKNQNCDDNYTIAYDKYMSKILSFINQIDELLSDMESLIENEQEEKYVGNCQNYYSSLLSTKTYDGIQNFINNMERLSLPKKDINEEISDRKKHITLLINKIKDLVIFPSEQFIKENFYKNNNISITLINLVEDIYIKFNEYKSKNNMYSFMDIAKLAINIFRQNPLIADEIKDSLNEIMIDEYQDTSSLQETFINYISNNNLYLVGDIKQSIYRFRYANPDLFKEKYSKYKKHQGGYLIDLNTNFRSRKEVLENINDIFSLIMSDEYGGANYKKDHLIQYGNKSFLDDNIDNQDNNLEIYNYNSNDFTGLNIAEIEAFIVANDIKNKLNSNYLVFDPNQGHRKATYKDFTILVDKRSDFATYKKILEYFSLPVALYQNENIVNQDDLYCFKSILDVINGYKNNIFDAKFKHAFYSLAKSYLFSYKDNDILTFIVDNNFYSNNIYIKLKNVIDNLEYLSNFELFNNIIKDLNWYTKIIYKGEANATQARLAYLIKLARNFDTLDYTFLDIIKYFESINERELEIVLPTKSNETNSIKIMTIHNSKGLEFPICYFMGFSNMFNLDETKDNFIVHQQGIILPFIQDNTKYHNIEWFEYRNKYINEEISEKIRLLYVALTRAKEKMIIPLDLNSSDPKLVEDSRCFADFIIGIKDKIHKYINNIDISKLIINPHYKTYAHTKNINNEFTPFKYLSIENNKLLKEIKTYSKELQIEDENSIILELGTNLHDILFKIDFKNPSIEKYDNNLQNILKRFLNMPFLDINNAINFYKEYEFYYDEQHGKIDLIIEYKDHYKIIDYKLSNIEDNNYIEQIKGYKNYLQTITNKPIKLYLYSLLQGKYKNIE